MDYKNLQLDWNGDTGNLDYMGQHIDTYASTADKYWKITKFTWDVNGNMTEKVWIEGVWDDRATIFL